MRSYLGSYLGEESPADKADVIGSRFHDALLTNYKSAYAAISRMMPAERQRLIQLLEAKVASLPTQSRETVIALFNQTNNQLDPRGATGLGQLAAASTIANIATLVATLGTLGLQTATFIDQRNSAEDEEDRRKKQARIENAALQAQIDEQKARMARDQAAFDQQRAALRPGQSAPAMVPVTMPDGSVVMQPAPKSNTPILIGTGLAAAAALALVK